MRHYPVHSPILEAVRSHATTRPDHPALIGIDGTVTTYGQLWNLIGQRVVWFQEQGLGTSDSVILGGEKSLDFIAWYLGAHASGVRTVIVDAKANSHHLDHYISKTSPKYCFGFEYSGIKNLPVPEPAEVSETWSGYVAPEINAEAIADVMFTSGTTGKPKGVLLSHANVAGSASNINKFIGNTEDDVELLGLPLVHSFGLGRLRCNLLLGATVVLQDGFGNLPKVFATIEKYGVTGFGMVPAVWNYIVRYSGERIARFKDQLRYIEIGSASMPLEEKERLKNLFPRTGICMHYGLTEASRSLFTEFHTSPNPETIGTSVNPDTVEVTVRDEAGHIVPDGEEGEICVKGNMVIRSYLDPEHNNNAFFGEWFRTGDWGRRDADGLFYLSSRKKDLINVGGKKVSPVEIEEALEKVGVGESMCIAIPDPKGVLGYVPKALIVKGTFTKPIEEIREELRFHLETYKLPAEYEIVESIPKTSNGKKQRIQAIK